LHKVLSERKSELRKSAISMRQNMDASMRHFFENKIIDVFKNIITSGEIVAGYFPINSEFNILPLLHSLKKRKNSIALPCITESKVLDFCTWNLDENNLIKNQFSILEPMRRDFIIPDIVLVPGVLFDRKYNRLGFGGGYYDKTIEQYRIEYSTKFIGICYPSQIVPGLPVEEFDQKVDFLIDLEEI
jgi:5-formyltetrahydrofolate cyclo-ligase